MAGDDAEAMELLQNHDPQEAKAFIEAHKSRSLGVQWTQSKALAKIQQWYDMGAVKVWALRMPAMPVAEVSSLGLARSVMSNT